MTVPSFGVGLDRMLMKRHIRQIEPKMIQQLNDPAWERWRAWLEAPATEATAELIQQFATHGYEARTDGSSSIVLVYFPPNDVAIVAALGNAAKACLCSDARCAIIRRANYDLRARFFDRG